MKILVDMNLSPVWVDFLDRNGFAAEHWSTIGAPNAPDTTLLEWARSNDCVVLTHDLDFGILVAITHATGPSVVQLRSLNVMPESAGSSVVMALRAHEAEIMRGALITIDPASARVRLLPIRR